jgi:hypothetical protein
MPGWYFRLHYFVLVLPAFAILAGMGVSFLQWNASRVAVIVPVLIFAGVAGWNIYIQRAIFFQASTLELSGYVYAGSPFIESIPVAQYIREHSAADARVAVVGSEPQIYFYANRKSATGYIYTYAMMERQPYAISMQEQMTNEIENVKPEYIVMVRYKLSWLKHASSDQTIWNWVEKYTQGFYAPVAITGRRPSGEVFWQTEDLPSTNPPDECLIVYRRKAAAN